jgi:parvulin-like peptidyl-prolyl isomerase
VSAAAARLARACWLPAAALAAGPGQLAEPAPPAASATSLGAARPVDAAFAGVLRAPTTSGPSILLPSAASTDDAVADRHVYDRLLEEDPNAARLLIERIKLDSLVARAAQAWGVTVDDAVLAALVAEQEQQRRGEIEKLQPRRPTAFADHLYRTAGMTLAEYQQWLRTNLARNLYRGYVLRYAALRADRVEVRYIAHSDPSVLEDIATRVRQGADFATLAIRHTEDDNRQDGGLLPPFGRGFDHPVAEAAFELQPGELSPVFSRQADGSTRHYLVYCLRRIEGRDVPFAAVRDEIHRDSLSRDLKGAEYRAAAALLEDAVDVLGAAPTRR